MRKYLLILISSLFLFSCALHAPEIRGGEKFNLDKVDGQTIKFTAGANVYNGNWFGIRIKPSKLDLYVEGDYVGKVSQEGQTKTKTRNRYRGTAYSIPRERNTDESNAICRQGSSNGSFKRQS